MNEPNPRNILVVRTDRIGDLMLTLPLVAEIRQLWPTSSVTVMVREYTEPIVIGQVGGISALRYDREQAPRPWLELLRDLRAGDFDIAFVAFPRFRIALLLWLARIPLRVGTGYRWYSFLFNRKVFEHRKAGAKNEADYNLSLLQQFGGTTAKAQPVRIVPSGRDRTAARHALIEYGIKETERLAILHPGSGGSARDWPSEKFGNLAKSLKERQFRVLVCGTESEKPLIERVASLGGDGVLKAVGRFSLMEYGAFAELASVLVANSTGPLHLAAAVGTPVVGFYPPGKVMGPVRWGPLGERKKLFVPDHTHCTCGSVDECTDDSCMHRIEVEPVIEAVEALGTETVGDRLAHITSG